jgi:alanyl-tRNA synthetase
MTSIEMSFHDFIRQLDKIFINETILKASKYADENKSQIYPKIKNLQEAIKNLRKELKQINENEIQKLIKQKRDIAKSTDLKIESIKKPTINRIAEINPFHLIKIKVESHLFLEKKFSCIFLPSKLSPDEQLQLIKKDYTEI